MIKTRRDQNNRHSKETQLPNKSSWIITFPNKHVLLQLAPFNFFAFVLIAADTEKSLYRRAAQTYIHLINLNKMKPDQENI